MRQPRSRLNVVLNPLRAEQVGARRAPASADLSPFVEACWTSWWRLAPGAPHQVEILTDASGHLVFEPGNSNVVGVVTRKFTRVLRGSGRVVGIKLKAGALRALTGRSAREFTDRRVTLRVPPGVALRAQEAEIFAASDDATRFALAEAFLRAELARTRAERYLPQISTIQAMLARIERNFEQLRVETLAEAHDVSVRSLQRLFNEHVGVGPKWVIQRQRLLRAAEWIQRGVAPSIAELASSLGYFDQAHFTREFSEVVGFSPKAWAAHEGCRK